MSGKVASSPLLFASPASQENAAGTMPADSMEVSIGESSKILEDDCGID